jgi:hypothetical protein
MRPYLPSRTALAALAALCALAPTRLGRAQASPRVSLGVVSGPLGDEVADRLGTILDLHAGEVQNIPTSTYFGVASRLGVVGRVGEEDLSSVARELRLDAVLVGEMSRRGRGYDLRLRVARGRDGTIVGSVNLEIARVDDLDGLEAELWQEISRHIRAIGPAPSARNSSPRPAQTASATTQPHAPSPPLGPSEGGATVAPATGGTVLPGLGSVHLGLQAGWSGRSWRMPVLGERSPRGYDNGGYFEGGLSARIYYRMQGDRLGVGVYGFGLLPLVIASRGTSTEGMSIALQTTAFDAGGGLTFAYLPPGGGAFRADFGGGLHSFEINTSRLPVAQQLARMSYLGGRARGEGAVPLVANGTVEVSLLFSGELRVVTVGAEARMAYGENAPISFGFGGGGGLEFRFDGAVPGLGVRATGEWLRYRTSFAGRADVGTGSDSVDDYHRVHLGLSYAFGTREAGRSTPEPTPEPTPVTTPAAPVPRAAPTAPPRPRPTPPPRPQGPPPDPFALG